MKYATVVKLKRDYAERLREYRKAVRCKRQAAELGTKEGDERVKHWQAEAEKAEADMREMERSIAGKW